MTLVTIDLAKKDYLAARSRYAKAGPKLLSPDPSIDLTNYEHAIDLATVLQKTGEGDLAKVLLDRSEQVIRTMQRLGTAGYGIADARIAVLRGDRSSALIALREAVRVGWRGELWRYYRDFDPALASIRNEPEFKAVFADIERDMAQQRARLAARPKNAALEPTRASR